MTSGSSAAALRQIGTLFGSGTVAGMTDGQLLDRFLSRRDEGAEAAFAALVARHGPMVLGVCRRALPDPRDAEDAFQATFLILVRKARSVRVDDSLGRWLYGVSRKVAARARAVAARRPRHESRPLDALEARTDDPDRFEVRATLDEELARLPEPYRSAVVLCDLGGLSLDEAARELGRPVGTVKSRLSRGRARLRASLERRGLAPSFAMAAPAVPSRLIEAAVGASSCSTVGGASAAGLVPASAALLAEGMLKTMTGLQLKLAATALMTLGLAATGAGVMARQDRAKEEGSGPRISIAKDPAGPPTGAGVASVPQDRAKLADLILQHERLAKRLAAARRVARNPADPATTRARAELEQVNAAITRIAKPDLARLRAIVRAREDLHELNSVAGRIDALLGSALDEKPDPDASGTGKKASGGRSPAQAGAAPPSRTELIGGATGQPDPTPKEFSKVSMPNYVVEPPDIIVVEVLQALPGRPITGERLVKPDGTISLGFYGEVYVSGLTLAGIKEKVILHLRPFLGEETLGLVVMDEKTGEKRVKPPSESDRVSIDVSAYNSKVYYVQGAVGVPGRLPVTGNETVLDAINYAGGLQPTSSKGDIRLIRPDKTGGDGEQSLPVDYDAIVQKGDSRTNYQLFPGDRLIVGGDPAPSAPPDVEARLQSLERKMDRVLQALDRLPKAQPPLGVEKE